MPTIVAAGDEETEIVGFDKAAMDSLAADLSARLGAKAAPLFSAAEESLPAFRPG